MSAAVRQVPTVKDLRVKLCYICREEERADGPQEAPSRAWIHPCNCTLIAHEQCLLKWIQSSQSNVSRAPNALKCPQCGAIYEMQSNEPVMLKVLAAGNKALQRAGRYCTVFGAAAAVGVVGTSVYICLTAYGAWAVEKFIGKEMFDLILTDDPVNWPWSAYINLPLLPISLILSRFSSSSSMVIPLLLVWPPSAPVGEPARRLYEFWSKPENANMLSQVPFLPLSRGSRMWPPPPILFGLIGVPIVRALYRTCFAWVYQRVLGVPMPKPRRMPRGGLRFNEGPFVIRIRANVGDEPDEAEGGDRQGQQQQGQQPPQLPEAQPQPPQDGALEAEADPNVAAVEAAEQLIEINAASLGRRVGGALIIPAISHMMGTLLFRLSKHSNLLRAFLGIRQPLRPTWVSTLLGTATGGGGKAADAEAFSHLYPLPPWGRLVALSSGSSKGFKELSLLQQTKVGFTLVMNAILGGTRTWVESDPVWWRNGVGFGLFIAVKDCIQLLHLWLAKRELESRHVKDRDFSSVDIRELDLLPTFPRSA